MMIEKNKDLSPFTSWRVGGCADQYCAPQSLQQLKEIMEWAHQQNLPITLLGGGSNVLISDRGVDGLVVHTIDLNQLKILSDEDFLVLETEAGCLKSEALKVFLKYRLAPATFLAGLPGDMAGGVVMNAGVGHKVAPREFYEIVKSFTVFRINAEGKVEEHQYSTDQIQWNYRKSQNWQPGVIASVVVQWPNQPDDEVLKSVREGNKRRKTSQPLSSPSCGSVFKNPEGDHAGRLIEATGLKGFSIGDAQVSEKHANFIINKGAATATDIDKVIKHVQQTVEAQQGVKLTNEVVYLGRWS